MDSFPRPFGHVRDNYGNGHIFQHAPFSETEMLTCSTMPVYSGAQMQEVWQASRKQALEEARERCEHIGREWMFVMDPEAADVAEQWVTAIRSL